MDDELDIPSLRVVDLKVELEKRGLSKTGSKKELADRLQAFIDSLRATAQVSIISDNDVTMIEDDEDKPLRRRESVKQEESVHSISIRSDKNVSLVIEDDEDKPLRRRESVKQEESVHSISIRSDKNVSLVIEDDEDKPLKRRETTKHEDAAHSKREKQHREVTETQEKKIDDKRPQIIEAFENEKPLRRGNEDKKKEVSDEPDDFDDAIVMSTSEMFEDDFIGENEKRSPKKSDKSLLLASIKKSSSPQKVVTPMKASPPKQVKESSVHPGKPLEVKEEFKPSTPTAQAPDPEKFSDTSQSTKSAATQEDPTIIPFRRLARTQSNQQRSQKSSWSSINKDTNSSSVVVTSQELADIVPDIKPILESINEASDVRVFF